MSARSLTLGLFGGWAKPTREKTISRTHRPVILVRPASRGAHRSRSASWFKGDTRSTLTLIVGLAVVGMFIVYVFGINQSAATGYEVMKQKNQLNALIEENKKLLVRTAEVGSILQIQSSAAEQQLVQITNQEYLQINQLTQR